jgi:hypothetical protein
MVSPTISSVISVGGVAATVVARAMKPLIMAVEAAPILSSSSALAASSPF